MLDFMYSKVKNCILSHVKKATYMALACDEVTSIPNESWIFIHTYVMQDWVRILLLISNKEVVNNAHTKNLTIVLMRTLEQGDGLQVEDIISKLLYFEADGVATFQGTKIDVIKQITSKHAPYCIGVHRMIYWAN